MDNSPLLPIIQTPLDSNSYNQTTPQRPHKKRSNSWMSCQVETLGPTSTWALGDLELSTETLLEAGLRMAFQRT